MRPVDFEDKDFMASTLNRYSKTETDTDWVAAGLWGRRQQQDQRFRVQVGG